MEQLDEPEDTPALGKPIRVPPPAPRPVKVKEGVFQGPDGKLYTDVPANDVAKHAPNPWWGMWLNGRPTP